PPLPVFNYTSRPKKTFTGTLITGKTQQLLIPGGYKTGYWLVAKGNLTLTGPGRAEIILYPSGYQIFLRRQGPPDCYPLFLQFSNPLPEIRERIQFYQHIRHSPYLPFPLDKQPE